MEIAKELTQELDRLVDMYGEEELHPALVPYVEDDGEIMPTLRHPLVYLVPYSPNFNKMANRLYVQKNLRLQAALRDGEYETYLYLHERPHRIRAMLKILHTKGIHITDQKYWELLASIWIDTENFWQNREDWYALFTDRKKGRKYFMDEAEHKHFAGMPDSIPVYRGTSHLQGLNGLSWTLDRDKAKWFATRFRDSGDTPPKVVTASVVKDKVIGYLTGRGEEEIVALPWEVHTLTIDEVV